MAELTTKERLQPSLLDRLTDQAPKEGQESRDRRVMSMHALRQAVLRDLGWLLNTVALSAVQDLSEYPYAERSVVNYGLPGLAGQTASSLDVADVEQRLREAIWNFEPRILRDTVRVRAIEAGDEAGHNLVVFEIQGDLWGQPLPERMLLRTELDLEMAEVRVIDVGAG